MSLALLYHVGESGLIGKLAVVILVRLERDGSSDARRSRLAVWQR